MGFRNKAKKTSLQIIIPENLDNNEDPIRESCTDIIYKYFPSKLGALGPWERVEEERRDREGSRGRKCIAQLNQ